MKLFIIFGEIKENVEFLRSAKTVLRCTAESLEEARVIKPFNA